MKPLLKHIVPLLAVIVFASCKKDEAEVIPRGKMADIYAEMLMTDQWISSTPGVRTMADTSLVYEPILQKYGYDKMDYVKSVDHYMNDPERFSRIFRSASEKLDRKLKELRKRKRSLELEEEVMKKILRHQTDYSFEEFFPYLADEPYVHYYDSVTFEPDSLRIYRLIPIERADTLYDRIRMIIRDSLAVADTTACADSLALTDSLAVSDSIAVSDSLPLKEAPVLKDSVAKPKAFKIRRALDKDRIPASLTRDTVPAVPGLKSNRKWQLKE